MTRDLARAVSIIGHPTIVLPLAVLALTLQNGTRAQAAWTVAGLAMFAGLVMAYSKWQVRRGRWSHVDASSVEERRTLNGFLLVALGAGALLAMVLGAPRELALGLSLSAGVVLLAIRTQSRCKLSLHMAFVVFAAFLLGTASILAVLAGLAFAGLMAWSRLRLERHAPADIAAGAAAGSVAGLLFHVVTWYWTS
jgi:membrane-associated phospholipid phosphatase